MLAITTRSDEIAAFAGRILSEEEDSFKQRFVSVLARLSNDEWKLLEKIVIGIVADQLETTDEQAINKAGVNPALIFLLENGIWRKALFLTLSTIN